jgi:hypothetical protein
MLTTANEHFDGVDHYLEKIGEFFKTDHDHLIAQSSELLSSSMLYNLSS